MLIMLVMGLTSCEKITNTAPTEIRVVKNGPLDLYGMAINGVNIENSWHGPSNQSRVYTLYKVGDTFIFSGSWHPIMPPSYNHTLKVYVNNTLVQTIAVHAYQPVSYSFTKTN